MRELGMAALASRSSIVVSGAAENSKIEERREKDLCAFRLLLEHPEGCYRLGGILGANWATASL